METKLTQVQIGPTFGSPFGQSLGLGNLVSIFLSNAVAAAAVVLFIFILVGGIVIVVGAGNENPETAAKGKKAVTGAAIGFIIIFAAYWIIRILEIVTGVTILNSPL